MKSRKTSFLIIGLIFLFGLVFAFDLPAEAAGRLEPVGAPRPAYGTKPMVVAADERVFTLFAALNAAGFDREYEGLAMSPIRQQVRSALTGKNLPSLVRLKPIFDHTADYHLVVWVLQRGGSPEFGRAEPDWWVSAPAANFAVAAVGVDLED